MLLCGLCNDTFSSNDDLKVHLEVHASKLFNSDEEIEENGNKSERDSDQDSDEGSLVLDCVKEEEQLQGQQEIIKDERSENPSSASAEAGEKIRTRKSSKKTLMQCPECSYKTINKYKFKKHMNGMHLNKYKCEHCPKRYPSKGQVVNHIREKHEEVDIPKLPEDEFFRIKEKQGKQKKKLYECLKCTRQATNITAIYRHIRSVHRKLLDELYKSKGMVLDDAGYRECTKCSYKTLSFPHLNRHIETVHQNRRDFVCDLCKKDFPTKQYLLGHMKRKHIKDKSFFRAPTKHMDLKNKYKCNHCPLKFFSKGYLVNHVQKEHEDVDVPKLPEDEFIRVIMKKQEKKQERKHFECRKCKITTVNRPQIYIHIRGVHRKLLNELYWSKGMLNINAGYHKCTKCSFKTLRLNSLKEHIMAIHQKRQDYVCDLCKKTYSIKISLFHHMKNVHTLSKKLHKCSICSYKTKHSSCLKEHMNRIHFNVREFTCDLCKMRFVTKRYLRIHIERVHKEKICKHSVRCSFWTTDQRELTKHFQRVHLKMQGFSCEMCGEWYSTQSGLYLHKKTHNRGINKLICKLTCDLCQATASHRNNMHRHMKSKHLNY